MSVEDLVLNSPDPEVIEYVEYLLKRAKAGEIQSLGVVYSRGNRTTGNGMVGIHKNCLSSVGELEALKVDTIRALVELRTEYIET